MALSEDQIRRYSRSLLLREVGGRGQERWLRSRVRVVGGGETLERFMLFAARAGLANLTPPAERGREPESDLAVIVRSSGDASPAGIAQSGAGLVAIEGQRGVAITRIGVEPAGDAGACDSCRIAAARRAAGGPRDGPPGAVALIAGAFLASEALRLLLALGAGGAPFLTIVRPRPPFLDRARIGIEPGCGCNGRASPT